MGNPAVIFTTYGNSSSFATTNVSGHGSGNSTHSPFIELKSDAVPQAAKFSNGDFTVTDFDTLRSTGLTATEYANGDLTGGTHRNTTYSTRGTLGTFSLGGGQFELCEFDTGAKGSSIANHVSKSGVSHDYIAFANTGDGDGLLRNVQGTLTVPATNAKGPPTAYAPGKPFANIRIKNEMVPGTEGGVTKHFPSGKEMSIYDAAMQYSSEGVPLVIIGGKLYGNGSSRDWAAKGTTLLGAKAVIVESFERIHRSNLVGMGVLPLQFKEGQNRVTLKLDGTEKYNITGLKNGIKPLMDVNCTITRKDGSSEAIQLLCRIDTADEVEYYRHGGILHYVLRNLNAA